MGLLDLWPFGKKAAPNFGDQFIRNVWQSSEADWSNVAGLRGAIEETNSAVAACAAYLVDTMPEARLKVYKRTGDEDEALPVHRVYDLLETPNESAGYLWRDMLGASGLSLKMYGDGYLRIRTDGGFSQPRALEWIPVTCCEPKEAYTGSGLSYYEVTNAAGRTEQVDPTLILHFRQGVDSRNTLKGMSLFRSLQKSVLTDNEAEVYNHSVLKNLGVMGWVIGPDGPDTEFNEATAKSIQERFLRQLTGEDRGKPFVPTRKVKAEAVGHTPDKMLVREMRKTPEERICAVFRIPPIVVGLGAGLERSTMANTKEQREQAIESCNAPMWALMADVMTAKFKKLGMLGKDEFLAFDLGTVRALQEDEDKKHARARDNWDKGIWKLDEARVYTGKQAVEGGDVLKHEIDAQRAEQTIMARQAEQSSQRAQTARAMQED